MTDHDYMQYAIRQARQGRTPFGAVLVRQNQVIAEAYNTVGQDHDPSAHGEINVLRRAGKALGTTNLSGCVLYTTGEPCPMCAAAILYAQVDRIVYGASIPQIAEFMTQIPLRSQEVIDAAGKNTRLTGGVIADACIKLLQQYAS